MKITWLDWLIVALSVAVCAIPVLLMMKRSSRGTAEFFASGRSAPWWLIGVSMVATTFSTDTPNLVCNIVRQNGVCGNWVWWAFLLTGMLTVFFYARLWRRSGVLTDLEFYELRYSGKAASAVRGFRAVYLGLFFNCVIMAAVNLAAVKIANVVFGLPMGTTLIICGLLNVAFSATSGLWGVMLVDMIQFGIAMTGAILLAVFALRQPEVGGLSGLVARLPADKLAFLPAVSNYEQLITVLVLPLTVLWWCVWYPGSEPGGGSYIAQRMLAAKSERDALGGTLFFNLAHYALRPWPWVLVGLASILVYPTLADIHRVFPHIPENLMGDDLGYSAMMRFLPPGVLGLMIAGMLAAYISTLSTHLNWGASYLVHDFYRRFIRRDAPEQHYVAMGRIVTAVLMILSGFLTYGLETSKGAFDLLLSIGAGTGLLYLLRWFWWRINAWSEIAAMVSSFAMAVLFVVLKYFGHDFSSNFILLSSIACTTLIWVLVTFLTRPESNEVLESFFRKVHPAGPGWGPIRKKCSDVAVVDSMTLSLLGWILGVSMVWSALFSVGSFMFGDTTSGVVLTGVFVISTGILVPLLRRLWR
ncbi:MAG: Na+:solute symporter [Victivallales bacterium]|nr:Na+:solute symporter [Victivallales bacterium]